MLTRTTPYCEQLSNGLVLRSVAGTEDVERVAAFNGAMHGPGVADMTRELILNHPDTRPEHWLYVEASATGEIVSSLCLIPWTLDYEGVSLQAGEMGIVGTRAEYRHQGLVRRQAARHGALLREGGYHLSHIQGIPYFYRQFGYAYALPLEGGWRLELDMIDQAAGHAAYSYKLATAHDVGTLCELYERGTSDLAVHTRRDGGIWRYLLGPSTKTEMAAETWLVLDQESEPVAYLRIPGSGFGEGLIVNEASPLDARASSAVLRQLRTWSAGRGKPYIRLCLPETHTLLEAARYLGAHTLGRSAGQIKLVDIERLLRRIGHVLERRIAESPRSGLTEDVCLNLYREAYTLSFREGRLAGVVRLGFSDQGGIRIPPLLLAPLMLGYQSREELAQADHDVSVSPRWQPVVDVLFPKRTSFLYTAY